MIQPKSQAVARLERDRRSWNTRTAKASVTPMFSARSSQRLPPQSASKAASVRWKSGVVAEE